jgi:hypothetical protein
MQRKAPMVLSSVVASGCQITAHVTPSGAHAVLVSGDSTAVASKACVREGTPLAPVAATAFSKKVTANRPAPVLNVLHWVDATTQQVYILRGYTSIEELEALKKKLQR